MLMPVASRFLLAQQVKYSKFDIPIMGRVSTTNSTRKNTGSGLGLAVLPTEFK